MPSSPHNPALDPNLQPTLQQPRALGRKRNRGSRFGPYNWLVGHLKGLETRPDAETIPAKVPLMFLSLVSR